MNKERVVDYKPDWEGKCLNCEQTPTVDIYKNGNKVDSTGMCGPCTFGEAACLDPDEWNE